MVDETDDERILRQIHNLSLMLDKRPILKGVDARIYFTRTFDASQNDYITKCRWVGGQVAAISDEYMSYISTRPDIGDELQLGNLRVVLIDRSFLGDFWYVMQVHTDVDGSDDG